VARFPLFSAAIVAAVVLALPPLAGNAGAQLRWHPCGDTAQSGRCGTLSVQEDRAKPLGRRIDVALAVLPATGTARTDDPLLILLGGPGDSPLGKAAALARQFADINVDRDVILVDQRGTGRSSPLACFFGSDDDLQSYMNEFLPLSGVRECLRTLRREAALGRYRTRDFIADLEELRVALGVARWNLHGVSYGTRVALQYMARHPDRVRSAILMAPVPPELVMPVSFGEDADRALRMLAADCRADSACAAAFPRFADEADSVARRLERAPAAARVSHPVTGAPVRLIVTRGTFGEVMRAAMYTPQGARSLPLMMHEAYDGDYTAVAAAALRRQRGMARAGWAGLYLAVTCIEDVARADTADAFARNRNTILGDARARQHIGACEGWPAQPDGNEWPASHRATPPTLVVVGENDPATPPRWAELTMKHLVNGRLVLVPQGGHGFAGMEGGGGDCLQQLQVAFVETANPASLDTACVSSMRRLPFVTKR